MPPEMVTSQVLVNWGDTTRFVYSRNGCNQIEHGRVEPRRSLWLWFFRYNTAKTWRRLVRSASLFENVVNSCDVSFLTVYIHRSDHYLRKLELDDSTIYPLQRPACRVFSHHRHFRHVRYPRSMYHRRLKYPRHLGGCVVRVPKRACAAGSIAFR